MLPSLDDTMLVQLGMNTIGERLTFRGAVHGSPTPRISGSEPEPEFELEPEPEPEGVEEGEPPAVALLRAELSQLKLRALTKRAETAGVEDDALDTAEDMQAVIELVVAKEMEKAVQESARMEALRAELSGMKLRALTKRAEEIGVEEAKLDDAESTDDVIDLILAMSSGGGTAVQATVESHGKMVIPELAPEQNFHLVFSNKTAWDPLCIEVRSKLMLASVRIWQQQTNIPKDSENWFNEWYPSAVKARKIVCFISADYLRSPYCMKEFDIAVSTDKLLVVACEPISQILSVDVGAYPHCSNAHAYLVRGGQVIFNGKDDIVTEIGKFL